MRELALTINNKPIPLPSGLPSGLGGSFFSSGERILQVGIYFFLFVIFVAATAVLIYSGIQYIISGGEKEKIQKARSQIIYAILGLILALVSFFIVRFISGFFGINLISSRITSLI